MRRTFAKIKMTLLLLLLSVLLTARVSYSEKVSYAGYSVLEIGPASDKEMLAVREILVAVPCRQLSEQMGTTRPAHLLCDRWGNIVVTVFSLYG